MKYSLDIKIECGDETCAVEPGKFCHLYRGDTFGNTYCYIFGALFDKDGWLQRHPECRKTAVTIKQ
jgi:hypothetical protein